jgi:hypothetical protein
MTPEIHYIPNNYVGPVYIYFNQRDGANREFLDSKRLYRIPGTGNLKTKFKPNTGWYKNDNITEIYYVDDADTRIKRLEFRNMIATDSMRNQNMVGVTGIGHHSMSSDKGDLIYIKYIVDTLSLIAKKYPNYVLIGPSLPWKELNN